MEENKAAPMRKRRRCKGTGKARDPAAPKRPPTSFILYCETARRTVQEELGRPGMVAVSRELGRRWRALAGEEREVFHRRVAASRAEYQQALQLYTPAPEFLTAQHSRPVSRVQAGASSASQPYFAFLAGNWLQVATAHPALEGAAIQEILWETWSRGDRPANQGKKAEGDEAVGRDFVKENIENYTGKVETAGKPRQETSRNLSELPGKETAVEEDLLAVEEGLPAVGEDLSVPAKTPFMFFQQQTLVEIGRQNPDLTVQQRDELKESLKKKWTGIPDNARSQFIALAQAEELYAKEAVRLQNGAVNNINMETQECEKQVKTTGTPMKGPLDKQIEMKTSDGRRRITPILILPNSEAVAAGITNKYQMVSSRSKAMSKIRIENVAGFEEARNG